MAASLAQIQADLEKTIKQVHALSQELSSVNQCEGSRENRAGPRLTIGIKSLKKNPLGGPSEGNKTAWRIQ